MESQGKVVAWSSVQYDMNRFEKPAQHACRALSEQAYVCGAATCTFDAMPRTELVLSLRLSYRMAKVDTE